MMKSIQCRTLGFTCGLRSSTATSMRGTAFNLVDRLVPQNPATTWTGGGPSGRSGDTVGDDASGSLSRSTFVSGSGRHLLGRGNLPVEA